jgi:hypothetical protein
MLFAYKIGDERLCNATGYKIESENRISIP